MKIIFQGEPNIFHQTSVSVCGGVGFSFIAIGPYFNNTSVYFLRYKTHSESNDADLKSTSNAGDEFGPPVKTLSLF